jgi:hypothetical protein
MGRYLNRGFKGYGEEVEIIVIALSKMNRVIGCAGFLYQDIAGLPCGARGWGNSGFQTEDFGTGVPAWPTIQRAASSLSGRVLQRPLPLSQTVSCSAAQRTRDERRRVAERRGAACPFSFGSFFAMAS